MQATIRSRGRIRTIGTTLMETLVASMLALWLLTILAGVLGVLARQSSMLKRSAPTPDSLLHVQRLIEWDFIRSSRVVLRSESIELHGHVARTVEGDAHRHLPGIVHYSLQAHGPWTLLVRDASTVPDRPYLADESFAEYPPPRTDRRILLAVGDNSSMQFHWFTPGDPATVWHELVPDGTTGIESTADRLRMTLRDTRGERSPMLDVMLSRGMIGDPG